MKVHVGGLRYIDKDKVKEYKVKGWVNVSKELGKLYRLPLSIRWLRLIGKF